MSEKSLPTGLAMLALVSVAAMLIGGVAAATEPAAQFEVGRISVHGPTAFSAPLAGLVSKGAGAEPGAVALSIAADSMQIQTDWRFTEYSVGSAGATGEQDRSTRVHDFSAAQIVKARAGFYFGLFPVAGEDPPTLDLVSSSHVLAPPSVNHVTSPPFLDDAAQEPLTFSTASSIEWRTIADMSEVRVKGTFDVMAWEWDFNVYEPDGSTVRYETGVHRDPLTEDPSGMTGDYVYSSWTNQTVIRVYNGTLSTDLVPPGGARVYVSPASIRTDQPVVLDDVAGSFMGSAGYQSIEANQVVLRGDIVLDPKAPNDDRLPVGIGGNLDHAEADGIPVSWTAPVDADSGSGASWWWLAIGLVGAAVVVPSAWAGHRGVRSATERRSITRLEILFGSGRYEETAEQAVPLLRSRAYAQDAATMRAEALINLGRLDEAEAVIQGDYWHGPAKSFQNYMYANLYARRRDTESATRALRACLEVAPDMVDDVMANPLLADLVRAPEIRSLLDSGRGPEDVEGYA